MAILSTRLVITVRRAGGVSVWGALCALLGGVLLTKAESAQADLLLVKSGEGGFYDQAVNGFLEVLEKNGYRLQSRHIALKRTPADREAVQSALARRPKVVVVFGTDAARLVKEIQDKQAPEQRVPVVFTLVIDPVALGLIQSPERSGTRFAGVALAVPPQRQFRALLDVVPHIRRIGVVYNPSDETSNRLITLAQESAQKLGLELVLAPATTKESVPEALKTLHGKVDAFWLVPDPVCASPEPLGHILAFTNEQRLPLIAFSEAFVRRGALIGLGVDFTEQGALAGEQVLQILSGTPPEELPLLTPRRLLTAYNLAQARRLGVTIPETLLNLADKVFEQ